MVGFQTIGKRRERQVGRGPGAQRRGLTPTRSTTTVTRQPGSRTPHVTLHVRSVDGAQLGTANAILPQACPPRRRRRRRTPRAWPRATRMGRGSWGGWYRRPRGRRGRHQVRWPEERQERESRYRRRSKRQTEHTVAVPSGRDGSGTASQRRGGPRAQSGRHRSRHGWVVVAAATEPATAEKGKGGRDGQRRTEARAPRPQRSTVRWTGRSRAWGTDEGSSLEVALPDSRPDTRRTDNQGACTGSRSNSSMSGVTYVPTE